MIGKKVKWHSNFIVPETRTGKIVAADGNWLVVRADKFAAVGLNPFILKHMRDIEVAE